MNNERNIALMAIAEFVNYFSSTAGFNRLESIIVDGELRNEDIRKLKDFIPHAARDAIISVTKADERFKLVNIADNIANKLRKYYSPASKSMAHRIARGLRNYRNGNKNTKDCNRYIDCLITPKPEDYLHLIE